MYYVFFGLKKAPFEQAQFNSSLHLDENSDDVVESLVFAISKGANAILSGSDPVTKSFVINAIKKRIPSDTAIFHAKKNLDSLGYKDSSLVNITLNAFTKNAEFSQSLWIIENPDAALVEKTKTFFDNLDSSPQVKGSAQLLLVFGEKELEKFEATPFLKRPLAYKFTLSALEEKDIKKYIKNQLKLAGGDKNIFSEKALRKIVEVSGGAPEIINDLCGKALENAFLQREKTVGEKHIPDMKRLGKKMFLNSFSPKYSSRQSLNPADYPAVSVMSLVFLFSGLYLVFDMVNDRVENLPQVLAKEQVIDNQDLFFENADILEDDFLAPTETKIPDTEILATSNFTALETAQNEKQGSVSVEKGEELSKPNSSLESRLFATQELLRNEENSGVFIQLLGGTNEKILKQQIAELALLIDSNKIYAFRTIAKGKPYITILYGRFDDLESAREGIERLPNELKANRPYLRTTKGINSEIESNSKIPAN